MLLGGVIAIWLIGELASYIINKITNKKGKNDKVNNSIR